MKTPDTDKLVQALLDNEARHTMPDEERERVTREAKELWEAAQKSIPLQVANLFALQWHPACVHVAPDECECRCHTEPILHDKACCSPCARCGFRTAVKR